MFTKRIRNQAGLTLVEIMIATSILGVVLATSYMAFNTTFTSFGITAQNNRTYEIARRANNELTDKIRRAELPLVQAASETIAFNLDVYKGSSYPGLEQVIFTYVENDPDSDEPLHIVEKSIYSEGGTLIRRRTVATNVINKLVFDYFDGDRQQILMPQDVGDPNYRTLAQQIKYVRMTSRIEVEDVKGHPKNVNLQSEVTLRHAP